MMSQQYSEIFLMKMKHQLRSERLKYSPSRINSVQVHFP